MADAAPLIAGRTEAQAPTLMAHHARWLSPPAHLTIPAARQPIAAQAGGWSRTLRPSRGPARGGARYICGNLEIHNVINEKAWNLWCSGWFTGLAKGEIGRNPAARSLKIRRNAHRRRPEALGRAGNRSRRGRLGGNRSALLGQRSDEPDSPPGRSMVRISDRIAGLGPRGRLTIAGFCRTLPGFAVFRPYARRPLFRHTIGMSISWPLRRKAPSESKSLASPDDWLAEMFGAAPTLSGVAVSGEAALRVPAVSSAIRVISEAVASLDVTVTSIAPDGTETDDPANAVLPLLRDEANGWTSGFELIRDLTIDALVSDAGGVAWVNRVGGRIAEIIRYRRGVLTVDLDSDTAEPRYAIRTQRIPAQDVIHLRAPFGRAPLTLAREAIGVAAVMERHAAHLFGRGARPSGALKFPKGMGEESVRKARAAWRSTHEGADSGGRTAILFDGAEFEPFTFTSTDAQFLESRKFQILEIARAFRVPPSMLFELDRATWSNTEQMGREFLIYCLEPWLRALEGALRRALFLPEERPHFAIRFDRDDLTRADLNTRSTVINSLIASRVLNPNEGRSWLGLEPREGGDAFENPNIAIQKPGTETAAIPPKDAENGSE